MFRTYPKKIVRLELQNRSYDIVIGDNIIDQIHDHLHFENYSKIFVITDQNLAKFHLREFSQKLNNLKINHQTIILNAGEKTKDFAHLQNLCDQILKSGIDRKTLLIAFGGGVIGDLCGFTASILLRGIDFIQVPTTLLAMVDSSVGGKTAINSAFGKNLIGSFYQPKLVLADLDFIKTLPKREFLSGYAEVLKYGLIYDAKFFEYLDQNIEKIKNRDLEILKNLVEKSCQIKAEIVAKDEKENDLRALLNFGHTFGHIFETETGYSDELLHGEAVGIGMILAVKLSINLGFLDEKNLLPIENHLQKIGLPTSALQIRKSWNLENLISHIYKDKKTEKGNLTFILLKKIGEAFILKNVEKERFIKVISENLKSN